MSEFFTVTVLISTFAAALRVATPYLLAALGETIGQRSGVLNLGVDGVMLLSAFFSYWTVAETGSHLLGVGAGLGVGIIMGIIYAFISVTLGAEQGISGIGIFLFGLGFTDLLFRHIFGGAQFVPTLPEIKIPLLSRIPKVGEQIFDQHLLTYLAFLLVPAVTFLLQRTTFGMNIRAVGQNPQAADSLGVSVVRTRYMAVILGNALGGLAGAALVLEAGVFQENLTQGLGFIAVALVYFGAWRARGVMMGALLYGLIGSIVIKWKALEIIPRDLSNIASMAPPIITILALVLLARRVTPPAALTRPFSRH